MNIQTSDERRDDFLTISQAAQMLGVSPATLRNWDRQNKLEAVRHPMNRYRLYRRRDIQKIIEQIQGEH